MPKKKDQNKKALQSDQALLTPQEERRLHEWLADPELCTPACLEEGITSPAMAKALIAGLPRDQAKTAEVLRALQSLIKDKETLKEIRKTLFNLKQKGLIAPEARPVQEPAFLVRAGVETVPPEAYVGPIDGFGRQAVCLGFSAGLSGTGLAIALVHDQGGFDDFIFGIFGKRKVRGAKEIFFRQVKQTVDTSAAHAAAILEKAYQRDKANTNDATQAYLQLRPWILKNVTFPVPARIQDIFAPEVIRAEPLGETRIDEFLEHPLMKTWLIDRKIFETLAGEIDQTLESVIFISPQQREGHIQDLKIRTRDRLLSEEWKALYQNRLQEIAYFFYKQDHEDHARLAAALAQSFMEAKNMVYAQKFVMELINRGLDLVLAAKSGQDEETALDQKEKDSPLIIVP